MPEKNRRLVLAILDYLKVSMDDGTVKADDKEGLEVAVQCIGEAFGLDGIDDAERERLSIQPATLPTIFDVYLKTRERIGATSTAATSQSTAVPPLPEVRATSSRAPQAAKPSGPSAEDRSAAETLKQAGNAHMSAKAYTEAIESYTRAAELDPTNPVYYSNRAAAYSSIEDHDHAIEDAQKALKVDPAFVKAYSRLGHAFYCKEDYDSAVKAFQDGLNIDPSNSNLKTGLENAKVRADSGSAVGNASPPFGGAGGGMPDLSSLAGMFGGGGGGGRGGMPDLAGLLSNPALMSMAQNMMANGGMERMMQNPAVRNLAQNMQSGGGMPDFSELMNNPEIANLAASFAGGQGRGAGGAGSPAP